MAAWEKILDKMRNNPSDWRIEDLKIIADRFGFTYRQLGTSHVTFRAPNGGTLTVPAAKPIKKVYVKRIITFIDRQGEE